MRPFLTTLWLLSACGNAMTGMGFNDLSGWPADGITHVRLWDAGVAWNQIHTAKDTFTWAKLDQLVAQAQQVYSGVHFTYTIGGCPLWLAKYPNNPNYAPWLGPGSNSMPTSVDEFDKFVSKLATRYPQIDHFEVWNEPQNVQFLYPYTVAELGTLATMTERAYKTVKAIKGTGKVSVLSGSLCPRASTGGMKRAQKYLDAIKTNGWHVDAFSVHVYPENGKQPLDWYMYLKAAQSAVLAMKPPTKKVWVTETTYNLLGDIIPEAQAVNYVNATYNYAKALGVEQLFWYGWDQTNLGGLQLNAESQAWKWVRAHS
jgi:hypothetical protein